MAACFMGVRNLEGKYVEIAGLPVLITKKKMKNMYIRIDARDASVCVSAPLRTTQREVEEFVLKNMEWIEQTREKTLSKPSTAPVNYADGETISVWGQTMPIEFVPSYCDRGAYVKDGRFVIMAPLDSTGQDRKFLAECFLRSELHDAMEELIPEVTAITGKVPDEWHIRDMKTKWGTCNVQRRRIWISLMLVHRPKECLRYVMIHELTHLYAANHGAEFKAYMDKFCPEWREIKKSMKQ